VRYAGTHARRIILAMKQGASHQPSWDIIDTALLDLDGTLLDLAFDDWFWLEHVPIAYAAARGLSTEAARTQLLPRYRAHEGTLPWYCIEHWSRELALDIGAMTRAEAARVRWLPGAQSWLGALRAAGKRLVLLTNAHPETLRIKASCTGVTEYFDAVVSSHTLGAPKEDARFWSSVRAVAPFNPARSLFIDDSLPVVRAARAAGVRWVYAVRASQAVRSAGADEEFPSIGSVSDIRAPNPLVATRI
jgi:5'-nucleotidase